MSWDTFGVGLCRISGSLEGAHNTTKLRNIASNWHLPTHTVTTSNLTQQHIITDHYTEWCVNKMINIWLNGLFYLPTQSVPQTAHREDPVTVPVNTAAVTHTLSHMRSTSTNSLFFICSSIYLIPQEVSKCQLPYLTRPHNWQKYFLAHDRPHLQPLAFSLLILALSSCKQCRLFTWTVPFGVPDYC